MAERIDDEMLEYVSILAKIELKGEEKIQVRSDMEKMLDYADKLNELDTEGVIPTAHAIPMQNAFREDEIKPSLDRSEILKNAPEADEEGFIVPKVVE